MVFAASGKIRWTWGKLLLVLSWAVVAGLAFYWGRCASLSQARAAAPEPMPTTSAPLPPPAALPAPPPAGTSDYATQPVAYIYGTIPITRADLGEYLIARYGADRLELLINHRVIDHACQEKGIQVTAAEVEAALGDDLKGLSVNKVDFVKKILKHYNKTLYEWKEDVIRPRLMLNKLCRERMTVTDEDLRQCFEAKYGEQIRCRIVMWPHAEMKLAMEMYAKIRDNPAEFDRAAKYQSSPTLASAEGNIPPIGRHTLGNTPESLEVEKAIFELQPGEITALKQTPEGIVVFKCVERIPPRKEMTLEKEQPKLEQEILEKKTQLAIGRVFDELRKEANCPSRLLRGYQTQAEVEKEVERELNLQEKAEQQRKGLPPQGN